MKAAYTSHTGNHLPTPSSSYCLESHLNLHLILPLTSHPPHPPPGWVSSVDWARDQPNLFVSRCPATPWLHLNMRLEPRLNPKTYQSSNLILPQNLEPFNPQTIKSAISPKP